MLNRLKNNGRARLLPSWRLIGSAGASPSQVMNWLVEVDVNMLEGEASPALAMHLGEGENTFTAEFVMIVIATYTVRDPFIHLGKTQETGFEIDVKS